MSTAADHDPNVLARIHTIRRAGERHGVSLSDADVARFEAMIRSGRDGPECVWVRAFFHPYRCRRLYAVRFAFRWFPVLWDCEGGCIVTVLPRRVLAQYPESRSLAT